MAICKAGDGRKWITIPDAGKIRKNLKVLKLIV